MVGRTGFEPVTSSVSGNSRAVPSVCHSRTTSSGGALHLQEQSDWIVLGPGEPGHVGSPFGLSLATNGLELPTAIMITTLRPGLRPEGVAPAGQCG